MSNPAPERPTRAGRLYGGTRAKRVQHRLVGRCGRRCAMHELEGVVAKRRTGRYQPGERGWVKTKNREYRR